MFFFIFLLSNISPCNSYFQEFNIFCITIKDKLIKHLYNSHLRKLPIAHGEVSVMLEKISLKRTDNSETMNCSTFNCKGDI